MSGSLEALCVAAAGGIGAACRHLIDTSLPERIRTEFPWGIMLVNLSGSLLLGILVGLATGWAGQPIAVNSLMHLFSVASIGLLGGYTTFSAVSFDSVQLLIAGRYKAALFNGPGMLIIAVSLAVVGVLIGRVW